MLKKIKFKTCLISCAFLLWTISPMLADDNYVETVYMTPHEALQHTFSGETEFQEKKISLNSSLRQKIEVSLGWSVKEESVVYYIAKKTERIEGYALILNELGKHYPITFMVSLNPDLSVKNVDIMVYRERIGSEVKNRRFLKQFINKTSSDPIAVNRDINGISGATLSTWAVAAGVKKAVVIAVELIGVELATMPKI